MRDFNAYHPPPGISAALPFDFNAVSDAAETGALHSLAGDLRRAGLRAESLWPTLGLRYANRLEMEALGPQATPGDPRAALLSFFVVGRAVAIADLEASCVPLDLLQLLGFAEERERFLHPQVSILPVGPRLILCEPRDSTSGRDLVAAPDLSAYHLIRHARPGTASWLDLATGTGVVGIAGVGGAALFGADVNDRALAFAQASSWLNGIPGARWRRADLFDGIPPGRWETITCNPPLVEIEAQDRDEELPLYVAGDPGLFERFWRQVSAWIAAEGEVLTHSALPEDPDFPKTLSLPGEFTLYSFTLGEEDDFCITRWRPAGANGVSLRRIAQPENPGFGTRSTRDDI